MPVAMTTLRTPFAAPQSAERIAPVPSISKPLSFMSLFVQSCKIALQLVLPPCSHRDDVKESRDGGPVLGSSSSAELHWANFCSTEAWLIPVSPQNGVSCACTTCKGHKLPIGPLEGDMLLSFNLVVLLRSAFKIRRFAYEYIHTFGFYLFHLTV